MTRQLGCTGREQGEEVASIRIRNLMEMEEPVLEDICQGNVRHALVSLFPMKVWERCF